VNILITGITGFIGSNLSKVLQQRNLGKVWGISRSKSGPNLIKASINCVDEIKEVFRIVKPDVIFHLANDPIVKEDPLKPFRTLDNLINTHYLLEYCPKGTHIVFASSATVYGSGKEIYSEESPCFPTSIYGSYKLAAEGLQSSYRVSGKITGTLVRLIAQTGPGASHGVILAILQKLLSDNPTLDLFGENPGSIKPYMYVGDTVEALIKCINYDSKYPINISTDTSISVRKIAEIIMEELKIYKPINFLGKETLWPGDQPYLKVSNGEAFRTLKWSPKYDSKDAILRTVKDYVNGKSSIDCG
jgi:nucleoside-diphosphate-sugar epimerase